MSQQQAGHTIADIYKGVISDVINQVKEAFLDENIDIDVLQQLKKEWEGKLIASGSVDWEGPRQVAPPPIRQNKSTAVTSNTAVSQASALRLAQNGQHILVQQSGNSHLQQHTMVMQAGGSGLALHRPVQQVQYVSASSLPITTDAGGVIMQRQQITQGGSHLSAVSSGMIAFQTGQGSTRIVQQGAQQFIMHGGAATSLAPGSSVMILNANGQQIPVTVNSSALYQQSRPPMQAGQAQPKAEGALPMLDGGRCILDFSNKDIPGSSKQTRSSTRRKFLLKKSRKVKLVPQLDGVAKMSDSSSDEEDVDEDDDDDPLRRIADRIGEEGNVIEDEEQIAEEDPLNSGDDQSDDEDVDRLFEAENLVMCQFEKVHRARSKWKFTLKDGIMHIRGKDHCFQRCSGEAEW